MAIAIGLASLLLGFLTLGKRYLHKYRDRFMKTSLIEYYFKTNLIFIL